MLFFVALIFFIGIYPKPFLERIEPSVKELIEHVERNSDYRQPQPGVRAPRPTDERCSPKRGHVRRARGRLVRAHAAARPGRRRPRHAGGGGPHARAGRAATYAGATVALGTGALVVSLVQWFQVQDDGARPAASPTPCALDGFSTFLTVAICAVVVLSALVADDYLRQRRHGGGRGLRPVPHGRARAAS